MHRHPSPCATPIAIAVASLVINLLPAVAQAQSQSEANLPGVSVTAPKAREARASISGLGDQPEWVQPVQAQRYSDSALKAAQIKTLAELTKLDASITDVYNAVGYWDVLGVRGFGLDTQTNYRREGLPIYTQTSIGLDNKAAVEVFKGTSGMQAGMSTPGGLVNYVVKRPDERVRSAEFSYSDAGNAQVSVDLSERFGQTQQFGLRINAANERLNTHIRNTQGKRDLLAMATDWRLAGGTLIEAEMEYSRREQHSVPGLSMFGSKLPSASSIDPNTNLNSQTWAEPVTMQGTTGTLRVTHQLQGSWKAVATYGEQHTKATDRAAFPFGAPSCYVDGTLCDRYSDTGTFNVLNYRSDGERRIVRALDAQLSGQLTTGTVQHEVTAGGLRTHKHIDLPTAAFSYTGTADVEGTLATPDTFAPDFAQVNRQALTNELYLRDNMRLSEAWRAWAGLRRTAMMRTQSLTDGSQAPSSTSQIMSTPWLALGYEFAPMQQVYASWGEGVEVLEAKFNSPTAPIRNSGQVLPAIKSRQWEVGVKGQASKMAWSLDYFYIVRPEAAVVATHYQIDGDSRHQGIEGQIRTRISGYTLDVSAMVLDALRRHSQLAAFNNKKPSNVPDYTLRIGNGYRVAALPGLSLQGDIVHEGPRTADVANDVRIPAWTRVDASLALQQRISSSAITWRLGVVNLLDTRAWREAPYQFDHIYLLPMAARTITASAQINY
jgi:iron complex outermembrane receptor protein